MTADDLHTARVKQFFDEPERYLHKPFNVAVRATVVRDLLGPLTGQRIGDFGCGDGGASLQFDAAAHLTLLDLSEAMLALARASTPADLAPRVQYRCGDLMALDVEPFDAVICLGVLAHVSSVDATIEKLGSLVRPGGSCVLQLTDADHPLAKVEWLLWSLLAARRSHYAHQVNRHGLDAVLAIARRHGFSLREQRRYAGVLPGMGRLPNQWLYRLQMLSLESRLLAPLGSEVVIHLVRA